MKNLLLWGLAAAGVGYLVLRRPSRFLGDKADVGDDVIIPVNAAAPAAPGLPAGAGSVVVHVTGMLGGDVLVGPVTGYAVPGSGGGIIPLPTPTGAMSVQRSAVSGILRGGKVIS